MKWSRNTIAFRRTTSPSPKWNHSSTAWKEQNSVLGKIPSKLIPYQLAILMTNGYFFNSTWPLELVIPLKKILGWSLADVIFLTKYGPVNVFTDCTFIVVHNGFSQLMVIMYSSASDMYVPIIFSLSMTANCLWKLFFFAWLSIAFEGCMDK